MIFNEFKYFISKGILLMLPLCAHAQTVYYQDIIRGGVTADGFTVTLGSGSGQINLSLGSAVSIERAFLFCGRHGEASPLTIYINSTPLTFSDNSKISDKFLSPTYAGINGLGEVHCLDVTEIIDPSISTYNLTIPNQLSVLERYTDFYLIAIYKDTLLSVTNITIFVNNKDLGELVTYNISNINPLNSNNDISLAIHGGYMCDTTNEPTLVFVESQLLGKIGGNDYNNTALCGGVVGSFNYNGNILQGSGDDNSDLQMILSDGLSDIKSLISNNSNSFNAIFQVDANNFSQKATNPVWTVHLTYTSLCDTFEVNVCKDTTTCRGKPIQLKASGGIRYEWYPTYGLNCINCPNPMASPDSTLTYTVRVWNSDSCSKVLPVRVYVNSPVQSGLLQLGPSDCETNTGLIKLTPATGGTPPYYYTVNGITQQANALFENLGNGTYPVLVTDGVGCAWRDTINVPATVAAQAAFTANPAEGLTPLEVNFINQSSGAQHYTWYAQADTAITFNYTHTFQQVGNYNVMLVVYNTDSTCTDTARTVIMAKTAIFIEMPSLYHPNTDGTYTLKTRGITNLNQQWFDASGRMVYTQTTNLQPGETLNNGTLQTLAAGTYLYRITATGIHDETEVFEGKVVVVR